MSNNTQCHALKSSCVTSHVKVQLKTSVLKTCSVSIIMINVGKKS